MKKPLRSLFYLLLLGFMVLMIDYFPLFIVILPANCEDMAIGMCDDDLNRLTADFAGEAEDPAVALADISDGGFFIEVQKDFAKEMQQYQYSAYFTSKIVVTN